MPSLELPGASLWYADSGGQGRPIVFVHPAAASSECWEHQVPRFVASGYRCVTYDLRGWGRSRLPEPTEQAEAGYLSDDLAALVDHLGLSRFVLVGAAYGGFGALDYALRFSERLSAFVLATSQGGLADPTYAEVQQRVVRPEIRALPIELRELGPSYRGEDPAGVARWLEMLHRAGAERAVRQRQRLAITLPLLEQLMVPTLVLAGGADLLAPPALMRLLARRIPHSSFATLAEAGHSAHWERPAEWNRAVLDFLAGR